MSIIFEQQSGNISPDRAFWRWHLMLPLAVFLSLITLIETYQVDLRLSQWLFHLEGGVNQWPLRHAWITENLLHAGGHDLVICLGALVVGTLLLSCRKDSLGHYRRGLMLLFLSVLTSVLLVRLGKSIIHLDCPWSLKIFGGNADYFSLFSRHRDADSPGQCFPAGHASGGYAWVALYFFALVYSRQHRWKGLCFGLLLGMTFDIAQQLRGAHFLSHGIWTLGISWFSALAWYYSLFIFPERRPQTTPDKLHSPRRYTAARPRRPLPIKAISSTTGRLGVKKI